MLNPRTLANGQEQYETFKSRATRKKAVQYDYRHINGELFSCVKLTIEACRAARDEWLAAKENTIEIQVVRKEDGALLTVRTVRTIERTPEGVNILHPDDAVQLQLEYFGDGVVISPYTGKGLLDI